MTQHAKYSPSKLARIIACPGSVKLSESMPEESSSYADEGTMLHNVMADTLNELKQRGTIFFLKDIFNRVAEKYELTREQTIVCDDALDYFTDVYNTLPSPELFIEEAVTLEPFGIKDCYGTADVIIVAGYVVHVIDWKFGQGHYVEVRDNSQFMAYGLGALGSLENISKFSEVHLHVVQPRLDNYNSITYNPRQLLLWARTTLFEALHLAEECTTFGPSEETCLWCPAKEMCKARYNMVKQITEKAYSMYSNQNSVSDDDKAWLLDNVGFLDKYVKDLRQEVLNRILLGGEFPGYRVVNGKSSRVWLNEAEAREWLIAKSDDPGAGFTFEDVFETKMVTPAKAEKLTKGMKKDPAFISLVKKLEGGPTLVKADDKRPDYTQAVNASDTFAQYAMED